MTCVQMDAITQTGLGRQPFPTELLSRREASLYLADLGIPIRPDTLAVYAVRRMGPPHRLIAKRAIYVAGDVREWAEKRFKAAERHERKRPHSNRRQNHESFLTHR